MMTLRRLGGSELVSIVVFQRLTGRLPSSGPDLGQPVRPLAFRSRPRAGSRLRGYRPERWEPWRDWLILTVLLHLQLVAIAFSGVTGAWLLLAALPLGLTLATATLTVLHDAGHRRFSRRAWPNVLAVQSAAPVGLWTAHWTLKHRVHHRVTQVYPLDEATRSSGLLRLHPGAAWRNVHRRQHLYAWGLYSLAWAGELRSQLTFLRTGAVAGTQTPGTRQRASSFLAEKVLCAAVLLPYAVALGIVRLGVLLLAAMTVASLAAATVLVVGHINLGINPPSATPRGRQWARHQVLTSASFATDNAAVRWLTGGMTHHLAHHLRPVAARSELPALHETVVQDVAAQSSTPVREFASLRQAVRGHQARLRELGRNVEPCRPLDATIGEPLADPLATGRADTPVLATPSR